MKECYECGAIEELQEHHIVPKSRGGTKTVTLCYSCHMKSHDRDSKGMNHGRLTKEGIARAKSNGVKMGAHNPKVLEGRANQTILLLDRVESHMKEAREAGCETIQSFCDFLNHRGVLTTRGKQWKTGSMDRLLKKIFTED
jgi:hypothetical protein